MTLAVMTRASLGHTGHPKHAGPLTVCTYILVNLGAMLRVFGPSIDLSTNLVLGLAAISWSGAYLLFALVRPVPPSPEYRRMTERCAEEGRDSSVQQF